MAGLTPTLLSWWNSTERFMVQFAIAQTEPVDSAARNIAEALDVIDVDR